MRCSYAPPPASSPSTPTSSTASSPAQLGTVLYEGPVPPTKGRWLGIEWDEPTRGRHSGVYDKTGVRYFSPRVDGAGSFLRPDAKGLDRRGKTFEDALRAKYLDDDKTDSDSVLDPSPRSKSRQDDSTTRRYATASNFDVEVVLSSKVTERFHQLGRLREVGLEWEGVSRAASGADDEGGRGREAEALQDLGGQLSRLEVLNLSFSLLPSLHETAQIVNVLPRLVHLSLNGNRFAPLAEPTPLLGFERLRRLQLNSTLMTWTEIRHVADSLTNLEELEFGHNRLRTLCGPAARPDSSSSPTTILPKLAKLNLEANELCDWPEIVEELANLPSLTDLVLSSNRLSSLALPDPISSSSSSSASTALSRHRLHRLRHLDLVSNVLDAWPSTVDALGASSSSSFPALQSVRLLGNGVASSRSFEPAVTLTNAPQDRRETGATSSSSLIHELALDRGSPPDRELSTPHARLLLVARLPFIVELDGTPVSRAERDDAERFWLEQLAKGAEDEAQLGEWASGRLDEVRRKHGQVESPSRVAVGSASSTLTAPRAKLKDRLIRAPNILSPRLGAALTRLLADLHVHLPLSTTSASTPLALAVLPSLRTLLLRTQISRTSGTPLPKSRYRLVAVLQPAEGEADEVRVEIPPAEEGKELSWWGLGDGDTVEVVLVE
ncbi:hypothetical protein JCM9279_007595 [Rhodotorula babjevae]